MNRILNTPPYPNAQNVLAGVFVAAGPPASTGHGRPATRHQGGGSGDFTSHLELAKDRAPVRLADTTNQRAHFHFSVSIQSEELFMLSAMRGLAWECQPQINRQIAVAAASNDQWKRDQGEATFYFTSTSNRTEFLRELNLLFRTGWEKTNLDDKKTAPRQS